MYEIKDGSRTLQFSGKKVAESSSHRPGSSRWIEFKLFKTDMGAYVLSRVGVSLVFHTPTCPLVKKYSLQEISTVDLDQDAEPCEVCGPTYEVPFVFPEKLRNWAMVSEDPESVIEALYKYDDANKTRYLTRVAERLLELASENDPEISSTYTIQRIP